MSYIQSVFEVDYSPALEHKRDLTCRQCRQTQVLLHRILSQSSGQRHVDFDKIDEMPEEEKFKFNELNFWMKAKSTKVLLHIFSEEFPFLFHPHGASTNR